MVLYRRNRVSGGTYFFTVTLRDRTSRLLVESAGELRCAHADVQSRRPLETVAIVILPDHLHAIWRLPEGNDDYSGRWRAIKAGFVRNLRRGENSLPVNSRGEADIWQRRFWEHTIRNEADLRAHVDYLHWNPVKHGHAPRVSDWSHSSFHRYVRDGVLPEDWGGSVTLPNRENGYGE